MMLMLPVQSVEFIEFESKHCHMDNPYTQLDMSIFSEIGDYEASVQRFGMSLFCDFRDQTSHVYNANERV
jgi:hypothetical protein